MVCLGQFGAIPFWELKIGGIETIETLREWSKQMHFLLVRFYTTFCKVDCLLCLFDANCQIVVQLAHGSTKLAAFHFLIPWNQAPARQKTPLRSMFSLNLFQRRRKHPFPIIERKMHTLKLSSFCIYDTS